MKFSLVQATLGRDLLTMEVLCLHPLRERCCLVLGAGRESVHYPSLRRQLGHTALDDAFVAPQWRQTQLLIALIMVPAIWAFLLSIRSSHVTI